MSRPGPHPHDDDLPMDPDLTDGGPSRVELPPAPTSRLVGVIAVGGVLGSLGRYGLTQAVPTAYGAVPWATFTANVSGSLLLGLLMVLVAGVLPPSRYLRPFLGVGVLGGFTTFSTYTSDVRGLLAAGHVPVAFAYLFGTLAACLVATIVGIRLGRLLEGRRG